jgi:preprotein translocase subunit YajC
MAATGTDPTLAIVYIAAIAGIFYFLLYRPQQAQRKKVKELVSSLVVGDEVMTAGGLVGTLRSIQGDMVTLEIADGVVVRFTLRAIIERLNTPVEPTDD